MEMRVTQSADVLPSMGVLKSRLSYFNAEIPLLSKALFWQSVLLLVVLCAAQTWAFNPALKTMLSLITGLCYVRLFIMYHDCEHKAIFRDSPFHSDLLKCFGFVMLSPPKLWRYGHTAHHKNNGLVNKFVVGEYPVVDTKYWRTLSPVQRSLYRFSRHPMTILFGYFYHFLYLTCIKTMLAVPERFLKQGVTSIAVHYGMFVLLGLVFSWSQAFFMYLLPIMIACAFGAYLFYAQHNAPDLLYRFEAPEDKRYSAFYTTTYFQMSPLMHWFCGNIGYHNVHHLIPTIPFYRLPAAFHAVPEFSVAPTTSWSVSDIRRAFKANLWDDEACQMTDYTGVRG